jgi:hypothetical protein
MLAGVANQQAAAAPQDQGGAQTRWTTTGNDYIVHTGGTVPALWARACFVFAAYTPHTQEF